MNKSPLSKHKDIEPGYKKLIIQHKIDCQELEGREDWTNEIQIQKMKYLYDLHISQTIPECLNENLPDGYILPPDFQYDPKESGGSVIRHLDDRKLPIKDRKGRKPKKKAVKKMSVEEIKRQLRAEGVVIDISEYIYYMYIYQS